MQVPEEVRSRALIRCTPPSSAPYFTAGSALPEEEKSLITSTYSPLKRLTLPFNINTVLLQILHDTIHPLLRAQTLSHLTYPNIKLPLHLPICALTTLNSLATSFLTLSQDCRSPPIEQGESMRRQPALQNWTPSFCRNPPPLLLGYTSPSTKRKLDDTGAELECTLPSIKKLREGEDSEEEEEPIENWSPRAQKYDAQVAAGVEMGMDVDEYSEIPIYTTPAQGEEYYEEQDESSYALVPYVPPEAYHFPPSRSEYTASWSNEVEYEVQQVATNDAAYDQDLHFPSAAPASTFPHDIDQEEDEAEIPMLSIPIPLSPHLEPDIPEEDREISPLRISPPPRPEQEQWRVGRVPGHQGSHVRAFVAPSKVAGMKRSLHEGITEAAEKVLKKPFRPPSKVVLPRAPSRYQEQHMSSPSVQYGSSSYSYSSPSGDAANAQAQSSPIRSSYTSARATAQFTPLKFRTPTIRQTHPPLNSTPSSPALLTPSSLPTSELSSPPSSSNTFARFASQRAKADFKAPFKRSPAPSPASSSTRGSGGTTNGGRRIAELEKKVQTLRQAVKYLESADEEEHTGELVRTWREAGRNVAEMLFDRVPKPDFTDPIGAGGGGMNPWDEVEMTEEQREAAKGLERNEKGELVNAHGEVIAGAEEATGDKSTIGGNGWNIGAMLLKFSVDPELLGWNEDEEDWDEVLDEY